MLTSDRLILVELRKAGSRPLKKLLSDVVGGEVSGKMVPYSDALEAAGKPVVGYVCNPLTWYLAQWQLGCSGRGEFHKRLTDEAKWDLLRSKRAQLPPKSEAAREAKALPTEWGATHAKGFWYADETNPVAFREWLQAVVTHRGLRRLIDQRYNNSPIARLGGLMTYQFFVMFVRNAENMARSVDSMESLEEYFQQRAITSHFVRSEAVGEDLRKVLEALNVPLNQEQNAALDGLKKRRDAEGDAILRFYDATSLRLIARREAFLNKLFDYGPPDRDARPATRPESKAPAESEAVSA